MAGCERERTKKDQDLQDERISGILGIKKSLAVGWAYRINMFTYVPRLGAGAAKWKTVLSRHHQNRSKSTKFYATTKSALAAKAAVVARICAMKKSTLANRVTQGNFTLTFSRNRA